MREIIFLFLLVASFQVNSQALFKSHSSQDSAVISRLINRDSLICDSLTLTRESSKILLGFYDQGFLEAAYEIKKADSCYVPVWFVGNVYNWTKLHPGNLAEFLISKTGYKKRFFSKKPFSIKELNKLFDSIIAESENNGKPFASIRLSDLKIDENGIEAKLGYEPGPEIVYDQLQLKGTDKVKSKWLESYLNIREGTLFDQSTINKISERIDQTPFLELIAEPQIHFQNKKAEITLDLKDVKANNLDGIIGFLPNEQEDGKLLVTGQLYLNLQNLFATGKSLVFQWQSLKPRSQLLDVTYRQPNIFKSAIDLEGQFYLLKEDSFFVNREASLAAVYRKARTNISLLYQAKTTSSLTQTNPQLDINDLNINYYGVSVEYRKNFRPGLFQGFKVGIEPTIGSKKIELNNDADFIPDENSIQYKLTAFGASKLKFFRNIILYNSFNGGKLVNDFLYLNDLFRVGGLQSIRGFNENFFFASEYAILQSEVQLYYQRNSYLFLFYDFSYLGSKTIIEENYDYPMGVGIGLAIKLNTGLLNIAYALGKSDSEPFDTRLSKFHFGYVARF